MSSGQASLLFSEVFFGWTVGAVLPALHLNGILAIRVTFVRNNGFAVVLCVGGRDRRWSDIALPSHCLLDK
jgi:hypothetical protein